MSRPVDPIDNGELPAEEEDSDDDELDGASQADSTASDGSQASGAGGTGKKKKKKKKGKKKKGGAENGPASTEAPASTAPKVDKAEADRRFNTALAAIKSEDPWIELSSSNLQDAKLKKLLEQLKKNDSITSLNLSQNALSDEGAQAIAAALGAGASVPGLITLDLRENNFSPQGLTILEGLTKVRRSLSIMTGPIIVHSEAPAAGKAGEKAMGHLNDSRLVRKYFQIGNEDDDSPSNGPQAIPDLSINPTDLWQQLDSALAQGVAGIPSQSLLLKTLSQQVNSELSSIQDGAYHKHIFRCPHVNACLGRLQTLVTILELTPPPVTVQYHKQPQPAIGSHRVFASETIATLVTSQNTVIDEQIAAAKLVPRILHLAISHPLCSALHARSLKLIRAGLVSKVDDLLGPVMAQPGWGLGLQEPQASPDQEDGGEEGKPLCRPLPLVLSSRGEAAIGVVSGSRSAIMGFVIEVSKDLQKVIHPPEDSDDYDDDGDAQLFNPTIKRALMASPGWCDHATQEPTGVLSQLAKEQEGDLGGPRAQRPVAAEGLHLAELAGGGLITGPEILALLQGMNKAL